MSNEENFTPETALKFFRKHRNNEGIVRGEVKKVSLNKNSNNEITVFGIGILIFLMVGLISGAVAFSKYNLPILQAAISGAVTGGVLAIIFYAWPMLHLLGYVLFKQKAPPRSLALKYSGLHMLIATAMFAGLIALIIYWSFATSGMVSFVIFVVLTIVMSFIIYSLPKGEDDSPVLDKTKESDARDVFNLYLGRSTGKLVKRSHEVGIAKDQHVKLAQKDASLNILALGSSGEGKTTALINPMLLQLLDQGCGGLILDVKGDFGNTVRALARATNKEIITIGVGRQKINLIAGLNPEMAANMLGALFSMTNGHKDAQYWVTQASSLCRSAFGFLKYFPEHYTLTGLNNFIFDLGFREEIETKLLDAGLSAEEQRILNGYRMSLKMFDSGNDKMQGDIKSSAGAALSHFTHADLTESFCDPATEDALKIEQVFDGAVFLLDLPIAKYAQSAKLIMALIKMRWFNVMQSRRITPQWNQNRPVFFMCDEYQDVITVDPQGNSVNDLNFWDKSRDTRAIGIISSQSISSFYSAVGNHDFVNTVLQNFRQKLCFKIDNVDTLKYLHELTGDVEVGKITKSKQKGKSTGHKSSSSDSTSETLSYVKEAVIDNQMMRALNPHEAVALLNIDQHSMDDILVLKPLYLSS